MDEKKGHYIESEIGRLEKVLIHSPGKEIEAMTPERAEKVLYNDIIPLSVVSAEHRKLKAFLSLVSRVYEAGDLLREIVALPEYRREIVELISAPARLHREEELLSLSEEDFLSVLVCGLKSRRNTLEAFLSHKEFDLNPLPNLYFTRDSAMIYLDRVISGSMAARVRRREALLMREIFSRSGEFPRASFLFDGALNEEPEISLEGGDFLVFSRNILIIGVSERTSPKAVDLIAERIVGAIQEPIHIFAVILPKKRATIHLDMIFTLIDRELALVYEPYILGHEKVPVVRMDVFPDGSRKLSSVPDLFHGLSSLGFDLAPVLCGGSDPLSQQREQWISGANVFALAPGKIIGYDCNEATFEALSRAGFTVRGADTFIEGRESVEELKRLVVGIAGIELARGGGGIRCMTMPLKREPL